MISEGLCSKMPRKSLRLRKSEEVTVEATIQRRQTRPAYQEYEVIPIPTDIPELGVKQGDEGMIENLNLSHETVVASVRVYHSTRRSKGMVDMRIKPGEEVVSFWAVT
jgi:hypothetical protein